MNYKQEFRNLSLPTIALTAALAIAIVFALAVSALTQSTVPPTARQAAADPAFASRMAHQAAALTAKRLRTNIPSRKGRALPQSGTLYNNGPYNGTTDAWTINFGFSTSESFTGGGPVTGLHFVYWDASNNDLLTTVDISIGSTSFGGTPQTLTGVTNTFLGTNQYGYYLYQADYSFSGAGSGSYVTLSNACTTSGCSVSNPIYWDENSGVGCTSQGCPSTAYENTLGSIPSETFSLDSGGPPPPPTCFSEQPQNGFEVIHDFTGGEDGASAPGVTIDKAGNLYGTAATGTGDWGDWLVYKLFPQGQNWMLTPLYRFPGDPYYGGPESSVIVGPEGRLYGTSIGGNCGGFGCGLVFSVSPQPTACLTGSCSWMENVLYRFQGKPDGANPYRDLGFDQLGNLYGTTDTGGGGGCFLGSPGCGTVYELTPSAAGWAEKILYSWEGDGNGPRPHVLLVGNDGNLYGTTSEDGDYGYGTIYQLSPSGSGWTKTDLYSFHDPQDYDVAPSALVQDKSGNLYGIALARNPDYTIYGIVFMLSWSSDGWVFTILRANDDWDIFSNLTIDAAGNLYGTGGLNTWFGCFRGSFGYVFKLVHGSEGWQYSTPVYFSGACFPTSGALALDAQRNLYGTTWYCGRYDKGTVWQLSP